MYRQDKNNRFISNDECEFDIFNNKELCDGTIEDDIVNRQIHCDLRKIIETLPENQKEVVLMRYYKDLSFKEIADLTNVSINTALGRMRYALINIRKIADDNGISLVV